MEETDEVPRMDTILTDIKSFFSGESDSAREQIARLDEASLRSLRDQLHSQLVEVIPAIAGRPVMKRMPGNVAKLADDCWAFGSSLAQAVLLKEADSVLKPVDRRIPASVLRSSSATRITSAETEKMEDILNNMVRMDREIRSLQVSETKLRGILTAQQVRIASLEERLAGFVTRGGEDLSDSVATPHRSALASAQTDRTPLQHARATTGTVSADASVSRIGTNGAKPRSDSVDLTECRDADSYVGVSTGPGVNFPLVNDASADVTAADAPNTTSQAISSTEQSGNALPSASTVRSSADTSVAITPTFAGDNLAAATDQVATSSHSASAPVAAVRQSEESAAHPAVCLAAEVARTLDIDRLAIAIVAQMKQRTGLGPGTDCDGSDSDDYEPIAYPQVTRPSRVNRDQQQALPPAGTVPGQSSVQPNLGHRDTGLTAVIGTDDAADVRAMSIASAPATFVLEGVHPGIPDSTVHRVVSNIVRRLSGFQKVYNGDEASGKSFTFIADGGEESVVLDPANWPLGLRVRKMEGRDQQFRETSAKQPFQTSRRDQQERRPKGQRQQQQRRKQRRQAQRQQQFVEQEDRNVSRRSWQMPETRRQDGNLERSHQGEHQEQEARQQAQPNWMEQSLPQLPRRQQPIQPKRQQLNVHQQQFQPQWPARPQVWQTCQPPPQPQHGPPPLQQISPLAAQQLQQQQLQLQLQHQGGGESLWHGQEQILAGPFRTDSWPSLPTRQQLDRPPVTTSGAATIQVPAATHGNGHRFNQ